MIDTDNWPSHAEELGRKTAQTLEKWVERRAAGKIDLKTLYVLVTALYDATSGLITREVSDMLADMEKEIRLEAKNKSKAGAPV